MQDLYKNIEYYNPETEKKVLIVFNAMIADMIKNKKNKFNNNWNIYYSQKT